MRSRLDERSLLEAARRGDHDAFRELVVPHHGPLYAHCYRMLRSSDDAEDALQDALLRAWRSLPTFTGRAPLRAWLYRIATNVCLTAIDKRARHPVPVEEPDDEGDPGPEFEGEPDPIHAGYERRETAALAMSFALDGLPAGQRAALILGDVLGFPAREAAATLGVSVASFNSSLQRARAKAESPHPVGAEHLRDVVEHCVSALARGDVDTVVGIAAETALPAERSWTYSAVPAY